MCFWFSKLHICSSINKYVWLSFTLSLTQSCEGHAIFCESHAGLKILSWVSAAGVTRSLVLPLLRRPIHEPAHWRASHCGTYMAFGDGSTINKSYSHTVGHARNTINFYEISRPVLWWELLPTYFYKVSRDDIKGVAEKDGCTEYETQDGPALTNTSDRIIPTWRNPATQRRIVVVTKCGCKNLVIQEANERWIFVTRCEANAQNIIETAAFIRCFGHAWRMRRMRVEWWFSFIRLSFASRQSQSQKIFIFQRISRES